MDTPDKAALRRVLDKYIGRVNNAETRQGIFDDILDALKLELPEHFKFKEHQGYDGKVMMMPANAYTALVMATLSLAPALAFEVPFDATEFTIPDIGKLTVNAQFQVDVTTHIPTREIVFHLGAKPSVRRVP